MNGLQWKHLRVVLWIALPYWACIAAFNIFNTYLFIKIGQGTVEWASPVERLLQHILMLPFLLAAYFAALQVRLKVRKRWAAFGLQAALAILFSLTYHPALQLSYGLGRHESWPVMAYYLRIFAFSPWAEVASQYIWCLLLYILGLLLLFNTVIYIDLRAASNRADDLQRKWLDAHLEALRGQLHPHFLFNNLNTVSSLILSQPERAHRLIVELSDLLRRMLVQQPLQYVSVREELDYIRKYLSVEQLRFEDRLQTVIEAEAEALDAHLPALILQPLVENAVKHGISKTRGKGELHIAAERRDGRLSISVSNTATPGDGSSTGHGIGLRNVRERLTAIYADGYEFSASQDNSGRWTTHISVPSTPPAALLLVENKR